jgi:Ca2+-binding RTX toxin-like protein
MARCRYRNARLEHHGGGDAVARKCSLRCPHQKPYRRHKGPRLGPGKIQPPDCRPPCGKQIRGTNRSDEIHGLRGWDKIHANRGDEVYGGSGMDQIYGRFGDDWIQASKGHDHLWGNEGMTTSTPRMA